MKEFATYTLMRLALFAGTFVVVLGIWTLASPDGGVPIFPALLISIVISGIASYFILRGQREQFARRVDDRASKAVSRARSKEDVD